jgi:excisionase family DNA binding protein
VCDKLLTVEQTAERLGTGPRFVRRLIAERRIGFVRLGERKGCPVRIAEDDLAAFVASGRVESLHAAGIRRGARRAVA